MVRFLHSCRPPISQAPSASSNDADQAAPDRDARRSGVVAIGGQSTHSVCALAHPYPRHALAGALPYRGYRAPVSGAFQSLGTVVSVVVSASSGSLVARARLVYDDGHEAQAEVKYGGLELLPLPEGQSAKLTLQPSRGADVGFGPGHSGAVRVTGGAMGVVIDGRGRPLNLPQDPGRRRELVKKWLWTVGG